MYIPRKQIENLRRLLEPGKVIVIYGARRVGKTTLVKKFAEEWGSKDQRILFVNGDDIFPVNIWRVSPYKNCVIL